MATELDPRRGQTAVRAIKSMVVAGGDIASALAYASGQGWTRDVELAIKAAISSFSTDDAATLIGGVNAADLLPLVRAKEIISRLTGIRRIPFDTPLVAQTGKAASAWVGGGAPVPASAQSYAAAVTLPRRKVVSMCVVTEELARNPSPSAEPALSRDFIASVVDAADTSFIDPTNSGSAAKPAAVTNGAPSFALGGSDVAALDAGLNALHESLATNGSTFEFVHYVMHPATLGAMALMRVSGSGALAYPELNIRSGGFIGGIPVIASASVSGHTGSPVDSIIALVDASRIWLADDGELRFETSRYSAIEMLDDPTNDSNTPTATTTVSLLQTNSVAAKGTRVLNFARADTGAVAVLTGVPF
jgi:HK97 family phage major capsid protein